LKRKYKLIIITLICSIITYLIYFICGENKINLVALGDGIASGETSYKIDGISYNDYLKDYFDSKGILNNYNSNFAFKNYKLEELLNDIKRNIYDKKEKKYIKQILHNADIITIDIGEEELIKLSITNDLDQDKIKKTIKNFDILMNELKEISDAQLVLVGSYENAYLNKTNTIILNSELNNIALKYNAIYIDISDLLNEEKYFNDRNNIYFNYRAHKVIADMIINSL